MSIEFRSTMLGVLVGGLSAIFVSAIVFSICNSVEERRPVIRDVNVSGIIVFERDDQTMRRWENIKHMEAWLASEDSKNIEIQRMEFGVYDWAGDNDLSYYLLYRRKHATQKSE